MRLKDIKVDEETWVELTKLKLELKLKTYNDVIRHLLGKKRKSIIKPEERIKIEGKIAKAKKPKPKVKTVQKLKEESCFYCNARGFCELKGLGVKCPYFGKWSEAREKCESYEPR